MKEESATDFTDVHGFLAMPKVGCHKNETSCGLVRAKSASKGLNGAFERIFEKLG